MPKADVAAALATPYDQQLVFRTEVRPYLYFASAGLLVLGLMFIGYAMAVSDVGFMGVVISGVGVFMLYVAWVNFWATRAGYPHLILHGHRLTEQSSDAFRRHIDLSALGETSIVVISGARASTRTYLGFAPGSGGMPKARRFVHQRLQAVRGDGAAQWLCRQQPPWRQGHPAGDRGAAG